MYRSSFLLLITLAAVAADAPSKPPVFVIHSAEAGPVSGTLKQLGEDWSLVLDGAPPLRVKGPDLVSLRRAQAALPPPPAGPQVLFANGDRVPGNVLKLANDRLHFQAQIGEENEVILPLTALSLIWFHDPAGADDAERLRRRLLAEPRTRDLVLFRNGDSVAGNLAGIDPRAIELDSDNKTVTIEREKVAAIALNNELVRSLRPKGAYGQLVLSNGCRLGLAAARVDDGATLQGKTLWGASIAIPLQQLMALDIRQGRAVYLSDLKPTDYQHTPYLGVSWPPVRDGSVAGNPLRLGGSAYDKGLGLHSQSTITYELGGAFRVFEALVGLDDRTGKGGSVRIGVLLDGKPFSRDPKGIGDLTWNDGPRPLRLNVAGVKELTLLVEFGDRGDVQDHVNWADARLLR